MMLEDKLLLWKFKQGSKEAFRVIYDKYIDELMSLATNLLNDAFAAEDIVQDVFVSFAQSRERFRLTGSLRSYLSTCVANRARNKNRDNLRHRAVELGNIREDVEDAQKPDRWVIYDEELQRMRSAFGQIPYEQREVIALHLQGDMKFKQIAKLQDVSIRTIESRYRYGIDKLRSLLNSEVIK